MNSLVSSHLILSTQQYLVEHSVLAQVTPQWPILVYALLVYFLTCFGNWFFATTVNSTFRYIYMFYLLSIKEFTDSPIAASYLDVLLNIDINSSVAVITTQLYNKLQHFHRQLHISNYLCNNILLSTVCSNYLAQLIR
jgi:hypothetical protein